MSNKKGSAGRIKGLVLFFLLFGPASLLIFLSSRGCSHKFKELDDMGTVKNYSFKGIDGKVHTSKDFKGKVVLITTIQKTCPGDCAISMWHLSQMIFEHIRKNQKKLGYVKIISYVTDGKGNPYHNLKEVEFMLKDQVEEYDPNIWILADGDAKSIYDITRNGKNLLKQKGKEYFGGEAFQELMLLADKQNHLRMVLKGNSEGMIRKMKEHIALLDKQYDKQAWKKQGK
jgi:hypothetical protein